MAGAAPRAVNVTTAATRLDGTGETDRTTGSSVLFTNNGATAGYWGYTNAVTTVNGTPIAAGAQVSVDLADDEELWAIASAGTLDFRVNEKGV